MPNINLTTRQARARLKVRTKPYWRTIEPTLHLGYRRGAQGGRWIARWYVGEGRYQERSLGIADDAVEAAEGSPTLDFRRAQAAAIHARDAAMAPPPPAAPMTVGDALDAWVKYAEAQTKSKADAKSRVKKIKAAIVKPAEGDSPEVKLADRPIVELTRSELEAWRDSLVRRDPDDDDVERRSKDSANRTLTVLKAALNRAFADTSNNIPSDAAWRLVKPFKAVGEARQVHLDQAQVQRLVNHCKGALRNLVIAAYHTGARAPGELARLKVRHFDAARRQLWLPDGKTGPRIVTLSKEATDWFVEITAGRHPDDLLLPNDAGERWKPAEHTRPFAAAAAAAKLPAGTCLYSLRHTYVSRWAATGKSTIALAKNLGTSETMLRRHYAKFFADEMAEIVEAGAPKLGLPRSNVAPLEAAG